MVAFEAVDQRPMTSPSLPPSFPFRPLLSSLADPSDAREECTGSSQFPVLISRTALGATILSVQPVLTPCSAFLLLPPHPSPSPHALLTAVWSRAWRAFFRAVVAASFSARRAARAPSSVARSLRSDASEACNADSSARCWASDWARARREREAINRLRKEE